MNLILFYLLCLKRMWRQLHIVNFIKVAYYSWLKLNNRTEIESVELTQASCVYCRWYFSTDDFGVHVLSNPFWQLFFFVCLFDDLQNKSNQ